MQVHARISKEWRRRMIFMFLMLFVSGVWFLSDGYIMWPAEAKRHEVYAKMGEEMIAAGKAQEADDMHVTRAWEKYAKEQGLKTKPPKPRSPGEIGAQRWIGGVFSVAAAIFAAWVAWNHKRSVRADGEVITGASGEKVNFDQIVEMDREKWANKGIAYAIYLDGGKRRKLTLDDHKFLGCEAIILEAERRIAARAAAAAGEAGASPETPTAA